MKDNKIVQETKHILRLGVPLIASQLVFSLSTFVSTAMVAHLGKAALAASILVSMIWLMIAVFLFGTLGAVSVLVAQKKGAKDYEAISLVVGQAYWLGAIVAVPVMLLLWYSPLALGLSHQPHEVIVLATQYFHAQVWCVPSLMVLLIVEQFLTGIGQTKIVLYMSLLEVPLEVAIIYVFVFGKLGVPALGVAGVGYGFAVTYFVVAFGWLGYIAVAKLAQPYRVFSNILRIEMRYIKALFRIGWPIGMMYVIELGAFTTATFFMAQFGSTVLAADQVAFQYLGFTITIIFAMAQAVTVRVGHAVGEGDLEAIKLATYVGTAISFFIMLCVAVLYIGFPSWLVTLDFGKHEVVQRALYYDAAAMLTVIGIFQLFDNVRLNFIGALRGLKDTRIPMLISGISFWCVGILAAWVFGFVLKGEGVGIWWGLALGVLVGACIIVWRFHRVIHRTDLTAILNIEH
jgi:multidrug resistance protein, MATE family